MVCDSARATPTRMDCCLSISLSRNRGTDVAVTPINHALKSKNKGRVRCCSLHGRSFRTQPSLFTASRLNPSVIRVMGPGSNFDISGFGNVLCLDEFFLYPVQQPATYEADVLTYFLEENVKNCNDNAEYNNISRHGIQVCFEKNKESTTDKDNDGLITEDSFKSWRSLEPSTASVMFVGDGKGKGGAEVRIVVGQFENVCGSLLYQESVLLDVLMRPGSEANISLNPSHGAIVYILEGVGIFNKSGSSRPFYENEGHGIWFPPLEGNFTCPSSAPLRVSSHMWSALRFLVLTSPL